jgi:hypothetical protein
MLAENKAIVRRLNEGFNQGNLRQGGGMKPRRAGLFVLAISLLFFSLSVEASAHGHKAVVEVAPGESIQQALDDNPGATIRLLAGLHEVTETLFVTSGQVIEGEGGDAKSGSLRSTLASSAPEAISTQTTEAVTFRDLNIEAQAEGIVHYGSGDLTIDNCRVASAQDPALPELADGRAVGIVNVFPSDPPEPGGVITVRRSEIVAGSENAGPGDRDAIGIFGFFNQASWQRIEVTESRLMTRQREGDQSAFAVGFEMLGMANADAEIVLRNNEISATGYGIEIIGFGGTATVEKNLIAADAGGIMYSSRSDNPGLIAKNEITVTGELGRAQPGLPGVFYPTACLYLGASQAGFLGLELAGNGLTGLVVEKNDLNCDAPGVLLITAPAFNSDPPVKNESSRNSFVKNDFNISGSESHVILGSETSDNWFVKNQGLRFDKVQDDGTNNQFD